MKKYILLLVAIIIAQVSVGYADEREPIRIEKTKRDFGKIAVVRTDLNPEKLTKLFFESCSHPSIGILKNCTGYLYEITKEGWLGKDRISFKQEKKWNSINLAAGTYYMKMSSYQGRTYYATGEISIVPFVTNFVHVALE
ncbi:hypothetical protein [Candidatus Electronema sp. JC]|uniref:hypothetical protein n=1 Tax=Candidatus Electronema sp. JC TaxID=3401570 RepID=UPI003B42F59A